MSSCSISSRERSLFIKSLAPPPISALIVSFLRPHQKPRRCWSCACTACRTVSQLYILFMNFPSWSVVAKLECSGTILPHCNFHLPGQAILLPQPPKHTGGSFVEMVFCHVGQAGLEFLTSGDLPASASQIAGMTGVHHHAQLH